MNRNIVIDISGACDKAELHSIIRDRLGFPEYYGGNLDALYDCLTEFGSSCTIVFRGAEDADEKLGGYITAMKRVCAEAVLQTPGLNIIFEESAQQEEEEGQESDPGSQPVTQFNGGWSRRYLKASQRKLLSKYRGNIRKLRRN